MRSNTEKHRRALAANKEELAKHYKKQLPCFGTASIFEGGKTQKHIVRLTMRVPVDFDDIADEMLEEVLEKLRADEHTYMTFVTASGQGGRALGRIVFEGKEEDIKRLAEDQKSVVGYWLLAISYWLMVMGYRRMRVTEVSSALLYS